VTCLGLSFSFPGGIAFETTFSISRLPAAEPGFTAGPDLPPLRIESAVSRFNPACGAWSPWHDQH
jgi:hypothetical protein